MNVPDTSPNIVPAEERHIEAAWQIIDACSTALREVGIDQWDDVYPTRQTVVDDVPGGRLFVLVAGAQCVATLALDSTEPAEYATVPWAFSAPALVIHRLCVDPREHGRGFGRALMDFAEAHAAANGYASIRLDAYSPNLTAVSLYRKRGYRVAGTAFFPRRTAPFYLFERAVPKPSPDRASSPLADT